MRKVLGTGAEATVYLNEALDSTGGKTVDKERSKKSYRHEEIDAMLRKTRTRKESKILRDLAQSGFAPKLVEQKDHNILMEYIEGIQLKRLLDKKPELSVLIGKNLTVMHDKNIIHGDLTTSNMILAGKGKSQKLFFIDFGLSFNSTKIEDKAVDIHLFKQALESKHFRVYDKAYKYFLKGYTAEGKKEILERLEDVEQRGRYKEKT
jgi:N6-L-threonylcarbamoyladenine synthase/protein kinase Bud32